MFEFIDNFLNQLLLGNASVIVSDNILKINSIALELYNKNLQTKLNDQEVEILKKIIMSCNILYNRTDMNILPVEDGFYDLLLESYKKYDSNFQVGSAVIQFQNFIETNPENMQRIATSPIIFNEKVEKNEIHQMMYDNITKSKNQELDARDFYINPVEFKQDYIQKRTHDTQHNHPSLVGTLDKCKFVLNKDAIDAGCFNDPNVKILERDFFQDHINKGIIDPNKEISIVAELKYDGISIEADCNLELVSARTRGDTGIGEAADMTPILKGYTFKHADCMIGEKPIGVKFEAIMTKSNLYNFNIMRGKKYSNCRTAIIGLFGASDAYLFRDLITLIPLALDREDIPSITNRMEEIEFLNKVFISHGEPLRYCYMKGTVSELLYYIKAFWDEAKVARKVLDFMYDGIVISYLDENLRSRLGRKNFINKYSIAVKFDSLEKQTIFRGYTYEVGQHGQITPMIHYDPVEFLGTIHTKSTGSSLERFKDLDLRIGDYINVTYRNDVMPYVSKLDCDHNRYNNTITKPEKFIDTCPICGTKLITSESGKTALCPNIECTGRSIQRMSNMMQKLNIKGFSDASIASLGFYHLYQLINASNDYIREKLGEGNGANLIVALNNLLSTPQNDYIIMGSLGFTSIAYKKWKAILNHITIADLYNLYLQSKSELEFRDKLISNISNIGEITSWTIAKEFPFFEKDIILILNKFNIVNSIANNFESKLQIRFTGVRNKHLSELLCNAHYDADDSSNVSKKTDILIVPYEGFSSSKVNKASEKCKIIPIDIFISNMEKYIDANDASNIKSLL